MFFVSVIEAVSVECCLEPRCRLDEKERVIDGMFLAEFRKEYLGNSRRSKLHMQQSDRLGIDPSVQPEPFIIQLDYNFVNCDVIRGCSIEWL